MAIRVAGPDDIKILKEIDQHINEEQIKKKISSGAYLLIEVDHQIVGFLRFGFFWDEHPFMNLLYVLEPFRGKGYGSQLCDFWEKTMKEKGHKLLITSTQSDEYAQHFYRKLAYKDIGSFTFPGDVLELMMAKEIQAYNRGANNGQ